MRIAAGCLGFLCCTAWVRPGFTREPELVLRVERTEGAEDCPEERELSARVETVRGKSAGSGEPYRVTFARHGGTLSAAIRAGDDAASVRVLETREATCDGLAQATAVTLALLIDSGAPPAPLPAKSPMPPPLPPAKPRERTETAGTLALGGAALFGVVRPVAPVVTLDLGVRVSAFRASVGALFMLPQELELGPGSVHERLSAGTARFCLSPLARSALQLDLCSGAWLGRRSAEGRGFTENLESETTWLGIPFEVSLAQLTPPFGWEIAAAALASFPRRDYTVPGIGSAYESWPVGAVLSVRGFGVWPW